ncbi:DUF4185 domain-containing protein [Pedobacter frigoris]|uniref:DUF4185 domain-containing protein n=1 Tax=Pedobacter frigoris TaxID=2571272 RepID=A0A4U1CFN4_9SPHI|nr:DUF4185 domain-containing protein [Pedobacter frigoris]TKC05982.1 DUF4185 domain-containing protein [Pedobacter frigoris]
MRKTWLILILTGIFLPYVLHAQIPAPDLTTFKFKVEESPEWTNLFQRTKGWFGGDGIYSIPLNGVESNGSSSRKTLFIFSDSMIGDVEDGKIKKSGMIHNSTAILEGKNPVSGDFQFNWKKKGNSAQPVFVPATPNTEPEDYYWLGDGFVNQEMDNAIYIFGYRVRQIGPGTFGFSEVGNTLIKIKASEVKRIGSFEQKDTPFYIKKNGETGSFGAGIYVNTKAAGAKNPDGYIYVYGVFGKEKQLLVARVRPEDFENYNQWRFWNGTGWTEIMNDATALTTGVSNELSMSQLPDGRFVLVFQEGGIGRYVVMRIGAGPTGPFGPLNRIWDCKASLTKEGYFAYNAKAHPSLSTKGELLISYNINSFNFLQDLGADPQFYRPRFISLKISD